MAIVLLLCTKISLSRDQVRLRFWFSVLYGQSLEKPDAQFLLTSYFGAAMPCPGLSLLPHSEL